MRVLVTGASGFIGRRLVARLEADGHSVTRVTRPGSDGPPGSLTWDPGSGLVDPSEFEGFDVVVNLNGRSIGDTRWNAAEKQRVYDSRIGPTTLLAQTLAGLERKPAALINASAIGIYGDRADEVLDEGAPPGEGFFPDVCADWESATVPASEAGIRVVNLRTGIVVGDGGVLDRLLAPFGPKWLSPYRLGLGGWIGNGRQWMSWISMNDTVRAIVHLITASEVSGPVNLVAPDAERNKAFMKAVGKALRRPVLLPIPRFVLRIVLGSELAKSTVFDSTRVVPKRLLEDGFAFADTDLVATLRQAVS